MVNAEYLCMNCMNGYVANNQCKSCGSYVLKSQELPSALPLRTILNGRYIIGRMLGAGGFGVTYLGYDLQENRRIAIKEFMPSGMVRRDIGKTQMQIVSEKKDFNDSMKRFLEEARMIYRYRDNPNVLKIYSLFQENSTAYYVMEYLEGCDLKHLMKQYGGRLAWQDVKHFTIQIIDALMVLHADGIVHRDISPDNIFISPQGKTTLIDFGAARLYMAQKQLTVILKRKYAPIEQYESKGKQGPWTDIYALAATIYHALTGELPPEATSRAYRDEIKTFRQCGVILEEHVEKALYRALKVEPEERYRNILDFKNDLLGIVKKGKLTCLAGTFEGMELTLSNDIVVGRNAVLCQLIYPSNAKGISNIHFKIIANQPGAMVSVVDLGSTYGTFVNEKRLDKNCSRVLKPGDLIRFGENQIWRYLI